METFPTNLIHEKTKLEGIVEFSNFTRFEGRLKGELRGTSNSELIIGQNGVIEGTIHCDTIIIDGFVRGEIYASKNVKISTQGKVIGKIVSPNFSIEFGGFFEGSCSTPISN